MDDFPGINVNLTNDQIKALKHILSFKKIDNYYQNTIYLTDFQLNRFKDKCLEWKINAKYIISVNYKIIKNKYPLIIYLTKKQIEENKKAKINKKNYF